MSTPSHDLVALSTNHAAGDHRPADIDQNLALPSLNHGSRYRANPAEHYLAKLDSYASLKTMRSHLNWVVRTIASYRNYDLEAKIESRIMAQQPGTEKEEKRLRIKHWNSVYADFDWHTLRLEHLRGLVDLRAKSFTQYRGQVQQSSPAAVCGMLAAVRGVMKQAVLIGLIDEAHHREIASVEMPTAVRLSNRTILSEEEIVQLLRSIASDRTARGLRDAAIVATILGSGLRRSEVGKIQVQDYQSGTFTVIGKGNKEAELYLPKWASQFVYQWLNELRDPELPGSLFCRILKGEVLVREKGLSGEGVAWILEERLAQFGKVKKVKPHDLRHTFAERMRSRGEDLATIQDAMRHSSPETTRHYLARNTDHLKKAATRDRLDLIH